MPVATRTEQITVDRELIVEAIALVYAAEELLLEQSDRSETVLSEFLSHGGLKIQDAIFGRSEGDAWARDPHSVEIQARGYELAAEAMEERAAQSHNAEQLRMHAKAIREAGTLNVMYPGGEVLDND